MESHHSMDSLRNLAPHWSLAGDDKLLEILQNTHKKIISKFQTVNIQLSEMTTALDNASISLQNVNNKFMALSNSQFIESRVYDDDEDVTIGPAPVKEPPKAVTKESNLSMLRNSLEILESMHELVTILRDSDTESDTDDDDIARVVLKPKDLYADRPLPYIIGSQAWKSKWHAGLVVEDSDSDSTASKQEKHSSEYSDSEPEDLHLHTDKPDVTISETSSELASEQDIPHVQTNKQTPSDIAAELARRLGGHPTVTVNPEPDSPPSKPTAKTVIRPQEPSTGTIFSDEPPPIDNYQSDSSPEDDDIFAELHKNKPQPHSNRDQIPVNNAADLFGFKNETGNVGGDVFNDFAKEQVLPNTIAKQKPTLFEDGSEPELFAHNVQSKQDNVESRSDKTVKKPVGGISVFGTNTGAESIGAAIMKRNARKSLTSDESGSEEQITTTLNKNTNESNSIKKDKDIFNDLFAKSEKKEANKVPQTIKEEKAKVDLFSDNLFDDIDDIFSTDVVKIPTKETKINQKSIFDDNDDLFADIAAPKIIKNETIRSDSKSKSIFDSDDELFSEKSNKVDDQKLTDKESLRNKDKLVISKKNELTPIKCSKNNENNDRIGNTTKISEIIEPANDAIKIFQSTIVTQEEKNIFDSDSDSDIFSNINIAKPKIVPKALDINKTDAQKVITVIQDKHKPQVLKDETLTIEIEKMQNELKISKEIKKYKSPSLFDDDDDLFNDSEQSNITEENINRETHKSSKVNPESEILFETKAFNSEENKTLNHKTSESTVLEKESENKEIKEELDVIDRVISNLQVSVQSEENLISESLKYKSEQEVTETENSKNNEFQVDQIKEALFPVQKDLFPNEIIFGEIVSEPPAFEKPKEPKRSQNINALFDDDSDDEALFFRKSDVIDDRPDDFSPKVNQDNLFGIFHDEPPAINIDFNSKTEESNDIFDTFNDSDGDLYSSISKSEKNKHVAEKVPEVQSLKEISNNLNIADENDMFSSPYKDEIHTSQNKQTIPRNIVESCVHGNLDKDSYDDIFNTETPNKTDNLLSATTKLGSSVIPDTFINSEKSKLNSIENTELPASSTDQIQELPRGLNSNYSDEELFSTLGKPEIPQLTSESAKITEKRSLLRKLDDSNEHLFDSIKGKGKSEAEQVLNDTRFKKSTQDIISDITVLEQEDNKKLVLTENNNFDKTQSKSDLQQCNEMEDDVDFAWTKSSDSKKIGRIKSMNFGIDVNALLPGASPKKQKTTETLINKEENNKHFEVKQPDLANKCTDESSNVGNEKSETKLVKSISFDSEPNSEILDNKVSKERAKIQVKRRPSTRRARREAARISVIDIDDSTDNSSSIDDAPKPVNIGKDIKSELVNKVSGNTKVTSKIVYILNDEDIFDTKPDLKEDIDKNVIEKSSEDTYKPNLESADITDGINTLGKVYNEVPDKTENSNNNTKNQTNTFQTENVVNKLAKKSIFDELSDDENELFDTNMKTSTKPSILFESDDENIFAGKTNIKVLKKEVMKGSLFGDDEDNDLFGVKTRIVDMPKTQSPKPSTSKESTKSTEVVFEDPLSMLENDD